MTQRNRTNMVQAQKLRLTQNLTTAMRLLQFDAASLTRYLEEQATDNPAIRLDPAPVAPGDWLPRWTGVLPRGGAGVDAAERIAAAGPSLMAHVTDAIARMFPPGRARDQAMGLAMALEPSGWLGRPLADLAAEAGLSLPQAETLLRRLQDIEPAGLFARNLRECLALQLHEAGWLDPAMEVVLAHLELVASGDVAGLSRRAQARPEDILRCLSRLRGLNPKPGTQFDPAAAPVREPDLTATRGPDGWQVALNHGALPALRILPGADPAARAAALNLRRQVEARGAALLRIAAEVLRRQEGLLDHGPCDLRAMTMAEVAQTLGLHKSTVSRAVAGVSIDTPRGTLWLRRLFSGAVGGGEDAPSGAALRARLARIVAGEDPAAPLTDAALAHLLAGPDGTPPARRTIAKYRAFLGVPPAHRRMRRPG